MTTTTINLEAVIAEIEKERDSVTKVYTPSAPYNWCIEAIKRHSVTEKPPSSFCILEQYDDRY